MLCGSNEHVRYQIIGGVFLFIYHLFASFIFPNLQWAHQSLELKYDPTFMAISIQVKLLIVALASFFPDEDDAPFQLAASAVLLIAMAAIIKLSRPCSAILFNIVDVGGYTMAAWMCISGLLVT